MFELKLRVFPNQYIYGRCVCGKQVEINKKPLEKLEEGREDAHTLTQRIKEFLCTSLPSLWLGGR